MGWWILQIMTSFMPSYTRERWEEGGEQCCFIDIKIARTPGNQFDGTEERKQPGSSTLFSTTALQPGKTRIAWCCDLQIYLSNRVFLRKSTFFSFGVRAIQRILATGCSIFSSSDSESRMFTPWEKLCKSCPKSNPENFENETVSRRKKYQKNGIASKIDLKERRQPSWNCPVKWNRTRSIH